MNKIYKRWFLPFIIPSVVLFGFVIIVPFVVGVFYSFTGWRGAYFQGGSGPLSSWVGISNYTKIFRDNNFINSAVYTIIFSIVSVLVVNFFALILALLICSITKAVGFFRSVYFLPNLLSGLGLGYIWLFIYENIFSKTLFGDKGILPISFLNNMTHDHWKSMLAMLIMFTWQQSGYMMLIYITGLTAIPTDYYEAASIDGAGSLNRFKYITLPLLRPSFTICLFLTLANSFKMVDQNIALTDGEYNTRMLALQILRTPQDTGNNYGMAQAEAVIFFVIIALVALSQMYFSKRGEIEA